MLVGIVLAGTTFGHDPECKAHCHRLAGETLQNWPELRDKESCERSRGQWFHHHFECHKKGLPPVDMPEGVDPFDCAAKGGAWSDYGHDPNL